MNGAVVYMDEETKARIASGDPTLPPNGYVSNWILHQFPEGYQGYCVDVGASDGLFVNSTYLLEKINRWNVLSVEANPYMKRLLMKNRAFVKICAVDSYNHDDADFHIHLDNLEAFSSLNPQIEHKRFKEDSGTRWEIIKVPARTVDFLLAEAEFPRLDALCIDVEGGELPVLHGTDLNRWKPHVIVVESWDEGGHDEYLSKYGYRKTWRSAENDCYIRREDV